MYLRNFSQVAILLLLTSCAQTPPKSASNVPPSTENTQPQTIVPHYVTAPSSTRPAAQDITYNSRNPPHFPLEAIRAGHYGVVVLMVYVGADSEVGDVRIDRSSGFPELDASAIDAAKHWRYVAEFKNGARQPSWMRIPVTFGHHVPAPPAT
ncbi:energy transducer TonB [Dyella mobilis]|uniref:Energy transducer TonB n=1 Tax=Dyella mobilis TaxID=1849582 RepID=A0ABS2KEF3_9GAMM|nr:energy transducer TonB [Dyella mobilis]MBM7129549.1 energy transducer TonB [Dyella mobilis]